MVSPSVAGHVAHPADEAARSEPTGMFSPAVVGGGVCGLTAGLVLQQEGYAPSVYEQASELDPTAVGVVVGTTGMRVLDHVGVAPSVTESGQSIERARILEANGRTLGTVDFAGYEGQRFGQIPVNVDRRVLLEALASALTEGAIEFDRECTGAAHQSDRIQVQFAASDAVPTEFVIGADGLNSAVRGSMFHDVTPRSTGWFAYRGIAEESFAPHLAPEARQVWGPQTRVSFAALGPDRVGWTAVVDETIGSETEATHVLRALSERCDGWPEPVRTLFARSSARSVQVEPLKDIAPLDRWHGDGIALAGDAAHACLPGLWQGIGQAMADAYTIGDRLRGADTINEALVAYEAHRKPIGDLSTRRSRQLLRLSMFERQLGRKLRNRLVRSLPEWTTHRIRRRLATVG